MAPNVIKLRYVQIKTTKFTKNTKFSTLISSIFVNFVFFVVKYSIFFGIYLLNDLFGQIRRHFIILLKLHGKGTAATGHGA